VSLLTMDVVKLQLKPLWAQLTLREKGLKSLDKTSSLEMLIRNLHDRNKDLTGRINSAAKKISSKNMNDDVVSIITAKTN
jgi:hypothetical protein